MSYRFTNTDKWTDSWFSNLSQIQMLLFIYLCDNCDIAGFIEINYKRWANDLNSSIDTIEGACKGLARGLIYSNTYDCIFIRNYLKHQKNLPLNTNNKAHVGIIKRFDLYSDKFDIKDINEFIEGACKGLPSPTGIGIGNGLEEEKPKKTKKKFIAPQLNDVIVYFTENGYSIDLATRFFNSYTVNDWKDSKDNPVKNWKQKAINVWFKPENKEVKELPKNDLKGKW